MNKRGTSPRLARDGEEVRMIGGGLCHVGKKRKEILPMDLYSEPYRKTAQPRGTRSPGPGLSVTWLNVRGLVLLCFRRWQLQ